VRDLDILRQVRAITDKALLSCASSRSHNLAVLLASLS
jgi:hypothetical protein